MHLLTWSVLCMGHVHKDHPEAIPEVEQGSLSSVVCVCTSDLSYSVYYVLLQLRTSHFTCSQFKFEHLCYSSFQTEISYLGLSNDQSVLIFKVLSKAPPSLLSLLKTKRIVCLVLTCSQAYSFVSGNGSYFWFRIFKASIKKGTLPSKQGVRSFT